jgi:hypothetical protein
MGSSRRLASHAMQGTGGGDETMDLYELALAWDGNHLEGGMFDKRKTGFHQPLEPDVWFVAGNNGPSFQGSISPTASQLTNCGVLVSM